MRLLLIPCCAVALVAVTATSTAQSPKSQDVSIKESANPTPFRAPVTLTGRVKKAKAGVAVVLQRRASQTAPYGDVATAATTGNGEYAFTIRPRRNGYYRAVARTTPEAASSDLLLGVSPRITLRAGRTTLAPGGRVRLRGRVRPKHNGSRVEIQRREGAEWRLVKRARLRDTRRSASRYRTRVRVPSTGTYRVLLPGHADHAEGVSPEVTLSTR
jgi:hypothetical protein